MVDPDTFVPFVVWLETVVPKPKKNILIMKNEKGSKIKNYKSLKTM